MKNKIDVDNVYLNEKEMLKTLTANLDQVNNHWIVGKLYIVMRDETIRKYFGLRLVSKMNDFLKNSDLTQIDTILIGNPNIAFSFKQLEKSKWKYKIINIKDLETA